MNHPKTLKNSNYRDTILPHTLQGQETQSEDGEALEKSQAQQINHVPLARPNTLQKTKHHFEAGQGRVGDSKLRNLRFPVIPSPSETGSPVEILWQKYHLIFSSDQAGTGIIAHDNTIDHNIVVVKKLKVQVSSVQRRQLSQILQDNPTNVVRLLDIFTGTFSTRPVYEYLETSLYHVKAASREEITEIELAIISKEVLQGLQYIHNQLGIVYGQLNARNLLLSFYTGDLKLANIADSVLQPTSMSFDDDIRASLQLTREEDVSELCRDFIKMTGKSSVAELLENDFLLKSPGVGRLRVFVCRAMEYAAKFKG
ncbi:uncharacterized protein ATNIH1004_009165 [Aspergillus tanneri]|uniref:Protein kinase domain-containing protein n=1 Tax=Aspergillus tanneri TaxID=1220188 RepID=A0A5M9MI00_9EURO|nr:uncharacterized protein ATNIH1004_009165 [Aspergillus tanneri]KAA8644954.1 hypothetical protein ATNIH1004_009165 [Aspergillus tanneri]